MACLFCLVGMKAFIVLFSAYSVRIGIFQGSQKRLPVCKHAQVAGGTGFVNSFAPTDEICKAVAMQVGADLHFYDMLVARFRCYQKYSHGRLIHQEALKEHSNKHTPSTS